MWGYENDDILAALGVIVAIASMIFSPIIATRVGLRAAREEEKRQLKLKVFSALLQTRHDPISQEAVGYLNLIDVVFHDDPTVRGAWSKYFGLLKDDALNNEHGYAVRDTQRQALLRAMAEATGYGGEITAADIARIYRPDAEFLRQVLELKEGELRRLKVDAELDEIQRRSSPATEKVGELPSEKVGELRGADRLDRPRA